MKLTLIPAAAALAAVFIGTPLPAAAKSRIVEPRADFGKPVAEFAIGTAEDQVGAHLDPGGKAPYGLFNGPMSFAVSSGAVNLVDTINRRIFRVDPATGTRTSVAFPKEILAADFAPLPDGGYALADAAGPRIARIDAAGKLAGQFGGPGDGPGLFRQADGIGRDAAGDFLVLDWGRGGALSRFSPDGVFAGDEKPGTALFVDSKNRRFRVEFHADEGRTVIYRAVPSGETETPLFKLEHATGGANLEVVGIDSQDRLYVKRFIPPDLAILRLNTAGKPEASFPSPSDPGMDFTRNFAVDPANGDVYMIHFEAGKIVISRLAPVSARAN